MLDMIKDILKFNKIKWEDIPDIGLYSEQVIKYISDNFSSLYLDGDKMLTPSMINNYVKLNIMPRPENKKYYRKHIGYLIVISLFKSFLSIEEIKEGMSMQLDIMGIEKAYNEFMNIMETTLNSVVNSYDESNKVFKYNGFEAKMDNISLNFVIQAFCFTLVTKKIIKIKGLYRK